jgi:hypothetical protein
MKRLGENKEKRGGGSANKKERRGTTNNHWKEQWEWEWNILGEWEITGRGEGIIKI